MADGIIMARDHTVRQETREQMGSNNDPKTSQLAHDLTTSPWWEPSFQHWTLLGRSHILEHFLDEDRAVSVTHHNLVLFLSLLLGSTLLGQLISYVEFCHPEPGTVKEGLCGLVTCFPGPWWNSAEAGRSPRQGGQRCWILWCGAAVGQVPNSKKGGSVPRRAALLVSNHSIPTRSWCAGHLTLAFLRRVALPVSQPSSSY